jgi:hypothetical protein
LYKTQVKELKEELEEKLSQYSELELELKNLENERQVILNSIEQFCLLLCFYRDSISAQLQLASAKCDSLQLARTIAEDQLAEAEKEKTMKELELRAAQQEHKAEMAKKELSLNNVWVLDRIFLKVVLF